jgi:hypothetical protein
MPLIVASDETARFVKVPTVVREEDPANGDAPKAVRAAGAVVAPVPPLVIATVPVILGELTENPPVGAVTTPLITVEVTALSPMTT